MIELQSFVKEDFSRLISWIKSEEELIQFAGPAFSFPLTEEQLAKYLEDRKRKAYKVIEKSSMQNIGHCEIYLSDNSAKLCRILIGDQTSRGRGYGSEIINQLLDICFENLNYKYVELNVYDWNIPAIRCYENAGFVVNPQKANTIQVKGKIWNSINMYKTKL